MCLKWNCTIGTNKCNDNEQCVEERDICDGFYDCSDYSDEWKCGYFACRNDMWMCNDGKHCIYNWKVCDRDRYSSRPYGCMDKSDEDHEFCTNWTCSDGYWKCNNNITCVEESGILDGYPDCPDGSDENLQYHMGRSCKEGYKMCDDKKQCVLDIYWCDGRTIHDGEHFTCNDGSDEGPHCENWDCNHRYWKCVDNLQCIPSWTVCDGNDFSSSLLSGCKDRSDEHNRLCGCGEDEWPCKDGNGCVKKVHVCDSMTHCQDSSDEAVPFCLNWICTDGFGKCDINSTRCVPWCEGKVHCKNGSDENDCLGYTCPTGKRKCSDNRQCVSEDVICDNNFDCNDGSDEMCTATCLQMPSKDKPVHDIVRRCSEDLSQCFPDSHFCDRLPDCPHASDETDLECSCEDWNMYSCWIKGSVMCFYEEWLHNEIMTNRICTEKVLYKYDFEDNDIPAGLSNIFLSSINLLYLSCGAFIFTVIH